LVPKSLTTDTDVFAEGGFDVVLGNPPYVRMEFLKELKPYLEKRYEVVSDRADLYCYFYEKGRKRCAAPTLTA